MSNKFLHSNNAISTLASNISLSDTAITIQTGDGSLYASPGTNEKQAITLKDSSNNIEIIHVTSRSGDVFTVLRGQEGTAARGWSSGDAFEARLTKAVEDEKLQEANYTKTEPVTANAGGTVDAITSVMPHTALILENGLTHYIRAAGANTIAAPTYSPDGLTAKTIVKEHNQALDVGDISGADHEMVLRYNSSNDNWILLNPSIDNAIALYAAGLTLDLISDVRQTVLTSGVDANGTPTFVVAGSGLNADLVSATTAMILAFAAGFSSITTWDFFGNLNADTSDYWAGLTDAAINFLYVDRNISSGALTAGFTTNLPPVYGASYLLAGGVGRAYSSFDGSDAAAAFTDANGYAWTFNGNAQLDTAQQKFGTASLLLDGAGDEVIMPTMAFHAGENDGGFGVEIWFRLNTTGSDVAIIGNTTDFHFLLGVDASDNMYLSLGTGVAVWDISNATTGATALSGATWYKARVMWDEATYKVYLSNNGAAETEEISVTSSVAFVETFGELTLGSSVSLLDFDGWIDDFAYYVGPQTTGTETPAAVARGGLPEEDEHFFDLTDFQMSVWDRASAAWVVKQRVFVGEAVTAGAAVSSIVPYPFRGHYDSDWFDITQNTTYNKSSNIGTNKNLQTLQGRTREDESFVPMDIDIFDRDTGGGGSDTGGALVGITNRNQSRLRTGVDVNCDESSNYGAYSANALNDGQARLIVDRGW